MNTKLPEPVIFPGPEVDQRKATAYHEAGHAVIAALAAGYLNVRVADIDERPRCEFRMPTWELPFCDKNGLTAGGYRNLWVTVAGRIAEYIAAGWIEAAERFPPFAIEWAESDDDERADWAEDWIHDAIGDTGDVAKVLLSPLVQRDAYDVLYETEHEVLDMLLENWDRLAAFAEDLLTRPAEDFPISFDLAEQVG